MDVIKEQFGVFTKIFLNVLLVFIKRSALVCRNKNLEKIIILLHVLREFMNVFLIYFIRNNIQQKKSLEKFLELIIFNGFWSFILNITSCFKINVSKETILFTIALYIV